MKYEDHDWAQLPRDAQNAATALGYTARLWNDDAETPATARAWEALSAAERAAAALLGHGRGVWDGDDDDAAAAGEGAGAGKAAADFEDEAWSDLSAAVRAAATTLGHCARTWNNDQEPAVCRRAWSDISPEEREAASTLGYDENRWNGDGDSDSDSDSESEEEDTPVDFEEFCWKDLPPHIQASATVLGFTQHTWDTDGEASSSEKSWSELTAEEKDAAVALGYTKEKWDDEEEEGPKLVLVQIYVETADYVLKDTESVGVSMLVNRDMGGDEAVFRAPVGPRERNKLLTLGCAPVAPEREAFAARFSAWQARFGAATSVGATRSAIPVFTRADFARRAGRAIADFPTADAPCYFFELLEGDYVIVEFVPRRREEGAAVLPERRQFEVLDYDEGIYWSGERGFDPRTAGRPPMLRGRDARHLELPGHFSNHACGDSATVYDNYRLRRDGDRGGGKLVALALSPELNAQLREWTIEGVKPASGSPLDEIGNTMTTHRAMKKGEEILTDYALWHWSNEEYTEVEGLPHDGCAWDELPQKVRDAAITLGITEGMWDLGRPITSLNYKGFGELSPNEGEATGAIGYTPTLWNDVAQELAPWFKCLCGDAKCHSKDGFRGVKNFPLEEQKRCYWLYSPYMQQQIDWKIYMKSLEANDFGEKKE